MANIYLCKEHRQVRVWRTQIVDNLEGVRGALGRARCIVQGILLYFAHLVISCER